MPRAGWKVRARPLPSKNLPARTLPVVALRLRAWPRGPYGKVGKTNGGYKLKESRPGEETVDQRDVIMHNGYDMRGGDGKYGTRKATGRTIPVQPLR